MTSKSLIALPIVTLLLGGALLYVWLRWRAYARADFVRTSMFPPGLFEKLRARHPTLTTKDCQLVGHALRQFFLAYLKSGRQPVSMPSQVADDLWHEMILYTRHYARFCDRAFGRFMHHTPAAVMGSNKRSNAGLRRTWWYCCLEENINPRRPTRLPLLFVLDDKLGIPNGFRYALDCSGPRREGEQAASDGAVHCGGDFADPSFDGGTDGLGPSSSSSDSGGSGSSSSHDGGSGSDGGDGGGCSGGCGGD